MSEQLPGDGPLLLTIDDEEQMRDIVAEVARMAGYRSMGACGQLEILHALKLSPDVIVLDMTMPDMDGIEVIWELARIKSRAALILLSGFDLFVLDAARVIARESALNLMACLTKPVAISQLKQLLIKMRLEAPIDTATT